MSLKKATDGVLAERRANLPPLTVRITTPCVTYLAAQRLRLTGCAKWKLSQRL